jgi:septal ring factor EnvC (AmiA/AmiB activator)
MTDEDRERRYQLLVKLLDLHKQATKERSHYYVGACVKASIKEIDSLMRENEALRDRLDQLLGERTDGETL